MRAVQIDGSGRVSSHWVLEPFTSRVGPEKELQDLLKDHPEIIPWEELGLDSNLKILGVEVGTIDGKRIDHLAVDENGHIYILECKIVKNHELRSVIAQSLEYAAQLSSIPTLDEFMAMIGGGDVFGDPPRSMRIGFRRSVSEADYRIIIVTDYAGSSGQARVNRKTVEYLRSSTEIHLVEVAKYSNGQGETLYVPHITAGGGPVERSWRQIEIWKRNALRALKRNPHLQAVLIEYLTWVESVNLKRTHVTGSGILSSMLENGHYVAYIEPKDEGTRYQLWISYEPPEDLSPESRKEWEVSFREKQESLGEKVGKGYYLLDRTMDPEALRNHLLLQQRYFEILNRTERARAELE